MYLSTDILATTTTATIRTELRPKSNLHIADILIDKLLSCISLAGLHFLDCYCPDISALQVPT